MPDNQNQQNNADNSDQGNEQNQEQQQQAPEFSWKSKLSADLKGAPLMEKFEDTPEGLGKAMESYGNLEKLLGHEKVPVPKGPEDIEGWSRYRKAMGVPDKADGYGLTDANIPEGMKGMSFDKGAFADVVHKNNLSPAQAKGLWDAYTQMSMDAYGKAVQDHQTKLTGVVNALRQEWGDAYDANVELGQMVINKFSGGDKEANDFLTDSMMKDPRLVKFLAQVGSQFAENKIGEFKLNRFAMSPDEAELELMKITSDPIHPYMNDKATDKEHDVAVEYVNRLQAIISKAKGQI